MDEDLPTLNLADQRRARNERVLTIAAPLLLLVLTLTAWELVVRHNNIPPYILPGPLLVLKTLWTSWPSLSASLFFTLKLTLAALGLAVIGGVGIGTLFALSRYVEISRFPYAVILQVTPIIAIAPLIMIYVDSTMGALLICAWIVAFFPDPVGYGHRSAQRRPQPARPDDAVQGQPVAALSLAADALGPALLHVGPEGLGRPGSDRCVGGRVRGRRFGPFFQDFQAHFDGSADAMFSMLHPRGRAAFFACAQAHGGRLGMCMTQAELRAAGLPPVHECAYNHTTLRALKQDRSWTYLQVVVPPPHDPALIAAQMQRYGGEMLMHHEFARLAGAPRLSGLMLLQYLDEERLNEVMQELADDGLLVLNTHVNTLEKSGRKQMRAQEIAFKRDVDPFNLMNPGKIVSTA